MPVPRPNGNLLWSEKVFFGSFIGWPVFGCNEMVPILRGFQKKKKGKGFGECRGCLMYKNHWAWDSTYRIRGTGIPCNDKRAHARVVSNLLIVPLLKNYQFSDAGLKANASNFFALRSIANY